MNHIKTYEKPQFEELEIQMMGVVADSDSVSGTIGNPFEGGFDTEW